MQVVRIFESRKQFNNHNHMVFQTVIVGLKVLADQRMSTVYSDETFGLWIKYPNPPYFAYTHIDLGNRLDQLPLEGRPPKRVTQFGGLYYPCW